MNRKVKSFKQTVFLSEQCAVSKVTTSVQRAVFQPWHNVKSYNKCSNSVFRPWHRPTIVLLLVYCLLAQKFVVRVCQVATVFMETMQLVLSLLAGSC